ncbi:UDP-N-acetylmuramoylalanyl-D-glutamate--2,6-diaminopimelate ligase [Alkalihalobacillus alcalophilus ATCC 27647 = CGMCC 1.3604]|uniref:UDP-N-acetylmuramoyl-tripeptide--D-alanyl-D-alanine ligase n=1 Tax=Alkalihalobacillus alcalophilus ATCC 27647 = CGMCC 1.3604 TaxID=1218173 RepID=A0A094XDZ6_ALKAL|nr:UDP-N-acetylmuramoyl-tripeptide--D-alanyl-D-alanine ligase [Alkalihalobacillus alcalophilus]KGA97015.1 UDP-N-acetylmuramoylalanyl-D-glutamate--2,6-diaminopimelate ligase [Alkalihalobacillus alcalophilus ATCC 27647 = CGMCC 1.3604]MED1563108.1 UDP-N-acetylmuramoyl-tripeptide--D-alanyl-D-alanine ligase [Alkalihalobacillus alcalophilus]THG90492.1 UDP-N-acetylmuramoylalanyl-D-glutamate--2,6-diaminopimelate ligase [Alkalihalobacillus alcalophilus ATCC 27647 = CGMCC 1.3604]
MLTSTLIPSLSTLHPLKEMTFPSVSTDTRTLEKGALYVPLVANRNGHHFVKQAIENQATAALWNQHEPVPDDLPTNFQLFFVEDTLKALQKMASNYRDVVNPVVIAITGSNGKTTTKDLVESVLSLGAITYKTQGNFNNHIGMPLTILAMPCDCQYLILEMGMSGFREIELLSTIAKPNQAIVTNIGESHMEQLGSREGIAKAKMEIVSGLTAGGSVFIDGDEELLKPYWNESTKAIGFKQDNVLQIEQVKMLQEGYTFVFHHHQYSIPLLGKHNVKNAAICIALAQELGFDTEQIQTGLSAVQITGMRLEKTTGPFGELVINDAYNASPTSMKAAIETVKEMPTFEKKIVVLGDLYELGEKEEELHRSIAAAITPPITTVIWVGDFVHWMHDEWSKHYATSSTAAFYFKTKEEAVKTIRSYVDDQTVILFKASRGMKLEELINAYQQEGKEG